MKIKKKSIGFSFAWDGLKEVIKTEKNFRIHLVVGFLVIGISIILKISLGEWSQIIFVIGLVLITEMINSALEKIIDYLKPEIHPAAKAIKDIGAGAVLVSVLVAIITGLIIFSPRLISIFL